MALILPFTPACSCTLERRAVRLGMAGTILLPSFFPCFPLYQFTKTWTPGYGMEHHNEMAWEEGPAGKDINRWRIGQRGVYKKGTCTYTALAPIGDGANEESVSLN